MYYCTRVWGCALLIHVVNGRSAYRIPLRVIAMIVNKSKRSFLCDPWPSFVSGRTSVPECLPVSKGTSGETHIYDKTSPDTFRLEKAPVCRYVHRPLERGRICHVRTQHLS